MLFVSEDVDCGSASGKNSRLGQRFTLHIDALTPIKELAILRALLSWYLVSKDAREHQACTECPVVTGV